MGLESATFINQLVDTNPTGADNASQGDNHIRLIKSTLKSTFANVTGAVTVSHTDINSVTGKLNLTGGTLTGALNGTSASFSGTVTATGGFIGNASTAAALQTARTINGVSFNGTANISFGADSVAEGATNLYFTNARARAAVSATGTGLSYNSGTGVFTFSGVSSVAGRTGAVTLTTVDVAEGANLYYTDARARSAISVSGAGSYNSASGVITINAAPVSSVAGRTGAVTLGIADVSGLQGALDGKFNTSGGSLSGNLSVTGTITATGDITAFSDHRLKDNVETITEALYKVKQMRGVSYSSRLDYDLHIGVIAQEVERVVPEVVKTHPDGLKSVAYGNLVGLLIEAIKALETRVAELESR
jgi:hypothetical protein